MERIDISDVAARIDERGGELRLRRLGAQWVAMVRIGSDAWEAAGPDAASALERLRRRLGA